MWLSSHGLAKGATRRYALAVLFHSLREATGPCITFADLLLTWANEKKLRCKHVTGSSSRRHVPCCSCDPCRMRTKGRATCSAISHPPPPAHPAGSAHPCGVNTKALGKKKASLRSTEVTRSPAGHSWVTTGTTSAKARRTRITGRRFLRQAISHCRRKRHDVQLRADWSIGPLRPNIGP